MKRRTFFLVHLLCFTAMSATAQTYTNPNNNDDQTTSQNTTKLLQSITNWAAYLGYDVTPQQTPPIPSVELLDYANASLAQTLLFNTYFGAIPITPLNPSGSSASGNGPFVSQQEPGAQAINAQANFTFQNYSSAGSGTSGSSASSAVVANSLIDQPPFQADPVSQSLLNILGTPDVSYCLNSNGSAPAVGPSGTPTCPYLTDVSPQPISQNQVTENVIGTIPTQTEFFSYASNSNLLPQLNSNSLIGPLTYDTQASTQSNQQNQQSSGLVAQNQLQQAANFIRYVSGSVSPTLLPSYSAYQYFYSQTQNSDPTQQAHGKAVLSAYLTNLRIYTAQTSVGLSNLYYILSKRVPQQVSKPAEGTGTGGAGGTGSTGGAGLANVTSPSQALNEYNMATWRLSNPAAQSGKQWIDKINSASPATVQKEIAVLLSEINYQLYLNRQLEERMLMTSSVSLLQGTKAGQPSSDLSNQNTSSSTSTAAPNAQ